MSLVIDSSIALAWFFEDEQTDAADAVMRQVAKAGAIVPSLWRLEVANALQSAMRRKRIDAAFRDESLADLRSFPISVDSDTDLHAWGSTLSLAERCRLTVYDAAYLELAQRLRLPLATLDQDLRAACRAVRVAPRPA
jgi:predicted nucleic acid-binding protein